MCRISTVHPWALAQRPEVSVPCRCGLCPLQRGVHELHVGEQKDAHGQLLPLLLVGAPAPQPAPQQGVQWWVAAWGAPASITGSGISLFLFPEPRVGEALSPRQVGWDAPRERGPREVWGVWGLGEP